MGGQNGTTGVWGPEPHLRAAPAPAGAPLDNIDKKIKGFLNIAAWTFVLLCPVTMPTAIVMLLTGRD